MNIGVFFGSPESTTGGNALNFYASQRLDIRRIGQIKEKETTSSDKKEAVSIGNRTRVRVVKNKLAPPFREVEFDILFGQGISRSGDIVDLATDLGIIEKSGAWFSYGSDRIGQGRENAKSYLEQHPQLMDKLEVQILAKHNIKRSSAATAPAASAANAPTNATAKIEAKPSELAPDGKPVVRIPSGKNGAVPSKDEEPKRAAAKPTK
jgi:recombination protein RecA